MKGRLKDMIKARKREQVIICAICVYVTEDVAVEDAVTIIDGLAVCVGHAAYIRSQTLNNAISLVKQVRPLLGSLNG